MKLRRVRTADGPRIEAENNGHWVRLADIMRLATIAEASEVTGDPASDMIAALQLGEKGWAALAAEIESHGRPAREDGHVTLPFQPASFRDFMLYEEHVINATRGYVKRFMPGAYRTASLVEKITGKPFRKFRPKPLWYKQPIYYFGNHMNFLTDGDEIAWPAYTKALDYELEIGAVLAQPLKDASPKEAEAAIGGFVVLNDVSARDVQGAEMGSGFGPQKAKHFINAIATTVVTADEVLPHIDQLSGTVAINERPVASCSSAGARYSLSECFAIAAKGEQLHPGEFIGSGTLPGGSGMENGHWLQPGDALTLTIDRIGTLTNTIAGAPA
ncbi:fumarylacetoacetate hydrolase family protein [Nitratireductor sp. XY-223]|uniref:fumarylacetoacetate hydrolase family protein n=1 Tax=Nitratireductor sp. XY-223 TaxID=2561926 RepID=UPI0010AB4ED8|nr:fumarylacetoacetate hydrolase family protein [Nitratireductor sp. XY-223]